MYLLGGPSPECVNAGAQLGVGEPGLIELSTGRAPDAAMRSALAAGKVVVFDDCLLSPAGTVRVEVTVASPVELPAYRATGAGAGYPYLPGAFISAAAADERGWGTFARSVAVRHPAGADVDALRAAAGDLQVHGSADRITDVYLVLAGVAALVALLCAGVTVGLSAADGRADLATLAVLGARSRGRRALAGAQALVVTVPGTLAGLVLGGCVGYAAIPVAGLAGLEVPWRHLALTVGVVPLLAAVVAVVVTPSRLPAGRWRS